jgi:hypothetical protein
VPITGRHSFNVVPDSQANQLGARPSNPSNPSRA